MQVDSNPELAQAAALTQEFADEVTQCQELPEDEKPTSNIECLIFFSVDAGSSTTAGFC